MVKIKERPSKNFIEKLLSFLNKNIDDFRKLDHYEYLLEKDNMKYLVKECDEKFRGIKIYKKKKGIVIESYKLIFDLNSYELSRYNDDYGWKFNDFVKNLNNKCFDNRMAKLFDEANKEIKI